MNQSHFLKKKAEPKEGSEMTEDAQMVPDRTGSWGHATVAQNALETALGAPPHTGRAWVAKGIYNSMACRPQEDGRCRQEAPSPERAWHSGGGRSRWGRGACRNQDSWGDVTTSATMKDLSFWVTAGELLGFMWA